MISPNGSLADLLGAADIRMVVVVDDEFRPQLGACIAIAERLQEDVDLGSLGTIDFMQERELWESHLTAVWNEASQEDRVSIYSRMLSVSSPIDPDDPLMSLAHMVSEPVEFLALSPEEWNSRKADLLPQAKDAGALVLIDQAIADGPEDWGIHEMISLLTTETYVDIHFALLTNTIRVDEEYDRWASHTESLGSAALRFVLLSKEHLRADRSTFVDALRVALMARPSAQLVEDVVCAIEQTIEHAARDVRRLKAPEFERMVFGLARLEGTWEIDTILRLFEIYQRARVRADLQNSDSVQRALRFARQLDAFKPKGQTETSRRAQAIYRRELYEDRDHMTRMFLPLELGDIFEKEPLHDDPTLAIKHFVLVVQPCDIMVRREGTRNPVIEYVTLLPILEDKPEESEKPEELNARRQLFELQAFGKEGRSNWIALDRPKIVPIEAVEYCVFNSDGRSLVPSPEGIPEWMLPNWKSRGIKLYQAVPSLESIPELSKLDKTQRIKAHYGVRRDCIAKPRIEGNTFSWGLRRVSRMLGPYPTALLAAYSAHLARAAFDRPLTSTS